VSLLELSLVEDADLHPLNESQQSRIQRNYDTLVNIINSKDGLTAKLYAADCITRRQKQFIEHPMITQSESNTRLIYIVMRGSEINFNNFIECLNETGQQVSHILIEDGAVERMGRHRQFSKRQGGEKERLYY